MTNLNDTNALVRDLHFAEIKSRVARDICEKLEECYRDENLAKALEYVGDDERIVGFLNQQAIISLATRLADALGGKDNTRFKCFGRLYETFNSLCEDNYREADAFCREAVYDMMRQHLVEDLDDALKQ